MKTVPQDRISLLLTISISFWLAATVVASQTGWLGSMSYLAPPPIAGLTILIPALLYFNSPQFRSYFADLGLRRLTSVHILRILAVPLFFWYGNRGLLPQPFVQAAGWGDLAAGVIALGVVLFWTRPAGYWTMHVFGMVDFLSAFATAIRLTAAHSGSMRAITGLPMALIPFFGVGVLATTHLIAFDLLLKSRGQQATARHPLNPVEAR